MTNRPEDKFDVSAFEAEFTGALSTSDILQEEGRDYNFHGRAMLDVIANDRQSFDAFAQTVRAEDWKEIRFTNLKGNN